MSSPHVGSPMSHLQMGNARSREHKDIGVEDIGVYFGVADIGDEFGEELQQCTAWLGFFASFQRNQFFDAGNFSHEFDSKLWFL